MKITAAVALVAALGLAATARAADAPALAGEDARINYSLGYQIGGDFKRQGVALDPQAVVKGIEDALSGAEPLMKPEEMRATLVELRRKIAAEQRTRAAEAQAKKDEEARRFLEENAKKPGISVTASGLQYQVLEKGAGRTPSATDQVTVHYRGTLVGGREFDSSYSRGEPATFRLDGVVKGWTEGLQLIGEGGKIRLFIPPDLAYGDRGPLAHQTLIFDVELISVGGGDAATSAEPATPGGAR